MYQVSEVHNLSAQEEVLRKRRQGDRLLIFFVDLVSWCFRCAEELLGEGWASRCIVLQWWVFSQVRKVQSHKKLQLVVIAVSSKGLRMSGCWIQSSLLIHMVLQMEERYVQKQINGHTWHAGFKYRCKEKMCITWIAISLIITGL